MFLELEQGHLTLSIDYHYYNGTSDVFDTTFGNWLPGDPPKITLNHVWIGHSNGRIDILNSLSTAERMALEGECLEASQEG